MHAIARESAINRAIGIEPNNNALASTHQVAHDSGHQDLAVALERKSQTATALGRGCSGNECDSINIECVVVVAVGEQPGHHDPFGAGAGGDHHDLAVGL